MISMQLSARRNSSGGWGLTLTPRDMARFGLLYLNHGVWNGSQIIPEAWVDDSISLNRHNYGYMWWLIKDEDIFAYAAIGEEQSPFIPLTNARSAVAAHAEAGLLIQSRYP